MIFDLYVYFSFLGPLCCEFFNSSEDCGKTGYCMWLSSEVDLHKRTFPVELSSPMMLMHLGMVFTGMKFDLIHYS